MQERGRDFQTDELDDLENDMLDDCGFLIYVSSYLWLKNRHANRFLKTMHRQKNPLLISNQMLKWDSQFLKGQKLT